MPSSELPCTKRNLGVVFRGSIVLLAGIAYGQSLSMVFRLILARYFGTEQFGSLGIALSVTVLAVRFSSLGLPQGVGRFVALYLARNDQRALRLVIRFGAGVVVVSSLSSLILLVFLRSYLGILFGGGSDFVLLLTLLAFSVPLRQLFDYSLAVLRGFKDMVGIAKSREFSFWSLQVAFSLLIPLMALSIPAVAWVRILSLGPSLAFSLVLIARHFRALPPPDPSPVVPPSTDVRRKLITHSLPLSFSSITSTLRQRTDVVIIGLFLSPAQAGIYYAAAPVVVSLLALRTVISRILMPVLTEVNDSADSAEMYVLYETTARLLGILVLPLVAFLMWFGDEIMWLLYGQEFVRGGAVLRVLAPGVFIYMITGNKGAVLQGIGKTGSVLIISVLGATTSLALLFLLVPRFGIVGAAVALSSSFGAISLGGLWFVWKYQRIQPFSGRYVRGLFSGISIFAGGAFLYSTLPMDSAGPKLGLFGLCAVAYLASLRGFGVVSRLELSAIVAAQD